MIPAVDSTPIKNGIADPLVSSPEIESSDGYLSNEMVVSILRQAVDPEETIKTEKYDGYIFNHNRCIQFNNRILCGYDKNKGSALDDYTMIDIGNGCRARGDRIECGYDNPRLYKDLRQKMFKHGGKNGVIHHHENKHHHKGHHHEGDKPHDTLPRQAPTRTPKITDATATSVIFNRMKEDYLENKLLKSAFSKLLIKTEETSKGSVKTTTNSAELTTLTTDTVKQLTKTTITTAAIGKTTQRKSRLTSRSTQKSSESTTKAATLTTRITTMLPTSSESNEISDGETTKRIVRLKPAIKPKRRRLTELLSTLPKLVTKSKPARTDVPQITKKSKTTINDTVLRMETGSADKQVKTACVEQKDRVVCYDFKT